MKGNNFYRIFDGIIIKKIQVLGINTFNVNQHMFKYQTINENKSH